MGLTAGNKRGRLVSEINVTPLVDVMLVLLIIFMITAPMMTQGVDVDLPETKGTPLRQSEDPLIVTINQQGEIFLNKIKVEQTMLRQQLGDMARTDKSRAVFLKADRHVEYGMVVSVMADIKDAGLDRLGMITEPAASIR